ncbi:MAG TPA: ADP compounds hydrolase NudE [Steroidobacteraceae bacterium]|nr:ADP compounds hydrolase NudE [Steroidobacteraceae bacterium]
MTATSAPNSLRPVSSAHDKPEILSVRTAARSRLFHIESVQLKFANGSRREFERIAAGPGPGTALVVAMPDPATVLLVREYAVGLDRFELSLPMGRIEPGESALGAANRELMEETGFKATELRVLHTLTLAPGILGYQAEIILATGLTPCALEGDEPEPLELVYWPLLRLDRVAITGEISEARTLSALFLARSILGS